MNNYTIYCTTEQTRKALELGAPIDTEAFANDSRPHTTASNPKRHDFIVNCVIPTAEQMLGWLEEQGFYFYIMNDHHWHEEVQYGNNWYHSKENLNSRKEATLASIDAALDYLIKNK